MGNVDFINIAMMYTQSKKEKKQGEDIEPVVPKKKKKKLLIGYITPTKSITRKSDGKFT